jgi:general secretion pathway protein M
MNEQWLKIKEWYNNLELREKRAVMMGGAMFVIFIIYAGIWSPLVNSAQTARTRLIAEQKLLVFMQAADKQLQNSDNSGASVSHQINTPVALLTFLQERINKAGLASYLSQLKQANNDSITLEFQKISFDKFIEFMMAMLKEQSITVTQLSVTPTDTLGIVTIEMAVSV